MNGKLKLAILVLLILFFSDCKKENTKDQLKDIYVVDITTQTDWSYWVVGKGGDYMFIKEQHSRPKTLFFKPTKDEDGYPIYLDDNGLPEKAVISGYIFLFGNFNGFNMDISIVSPNGQSELVRNIKTGIDWDSFSSKGETDAHLSDVIKWSGRVASGVSCGIGLAVGFSTLGVGFVISALGCENLMLGILSDMLPEEYDLLGLGAFVDGGLGTVVGCLDPGINCVLGIISIGSRLVSEGLEYIGYNPTLIQNIPIRVNMFLTKENVDILTNQGMNIYSGLKPPDITGNYFLNAWTNLSTGTRYIDISYKFYNLTSDLRLDVEYAGSGLTAIGYRGLIAGTSNLFSLFSEVDEVDENNGHVVKIKIANIYSGIMSDIGIQNFQNGFIIIAKENDIDNAFMNVGESRVIYEADYLAQKVNIFPFISAKKNLSLKMPDIKE